MGYDLEELEWPMQRGTDLALFYKNANYYTVPISKLGHDFGSSNLFRKS